MPLVVMPVVLIEALPLVAKLAAKMAPPKVVVPVPVAVKLKAPKLFPEEPIAPKLMLAFVPDSVMVNERLPLALAMVDKKWIAEAALLLASLSVRLEPKVAARL